MALLLLSLVVLGRTAQIIRSFQQESNSMEALGSGAVCCSGCQGGPRRGPMSLVPQSRDETHGNDAPRRFTNPEGVEFGLAPSWYRWGSTPAGSIGNSVRGSLSVG